MTELIKKATGLVGEFNKRFFDIPFGNSEFQNKKFVIEAQFTPGRGYRAAGLKLDGRLNALEECKFTLQLEEIDILELKENLTDPEIGKFDKMRKEVELEKKLSSRARVAKLVNDAAIECVTLWREIVKFPQYTREQFEGEEQNHFTISLSRQAKGMVGALASLDIITTNNNEFTKMLESTKQKLLED